MISTIFVPFGLCNDLGGEAPWKMVILFTRLAAFPVNISEVRSLVKPEQFSQRHLPIPPLFFYKGVKKCEILLRFFNSSPMSRLVSEEGNRTETDNVIGSVDDCSVSSAYLVQFVPPNSEN